MTKDTTALPPGTDQVEQTRRVLRAMENKIECHYRPANRTATGRNADSDNAARQSPGGFRKLGHASAAADVPNAERLDALLAHVAEDHGGGHDCRFHGPGAGSRSVLDL